MKEGAADELARIAGSSPAADERRQAIYILAQAAPNRASPALAQALKDKDPSVRAAAATACAKTGAEELLTDLRRVLSDADESVRREALYTLVDLGESKAGGAQLSDLLAADLSHAKASVRAKAADLLGLRGWDRSDALAKTLASDEAPWVRASAASALGKLKARGAAESLIAALDDDSSRVQNAARGALEEISGQKLGTDPAAWKTWLAGGAAQATGTQ